MKSVYAIHNFQDPIEDCVSALEAEVANVSLTMSSPQPPTGHAETMWSHLDWRFRYDSSQPLQLTERAFS
ncbi:hypothetical protein IL306_014836 [Fusarium sp. DS 682]|nr:hypothetical protein IL306_014836 [Fusarium sp. DS 682]